MWLFDDLLRKPPQPANDGAGATSGNTSGSGTGQQDDVLTSVEAPVIKIEKTTEQSILTDSVTPMTTPETESMPAITVDANASGIIVNGEAINLTPATPVVAVVQAPVESVPLIIEAPMIAEVPTPPVVATPPQPEVIPTENVDLGNLFGDSAITTSTEATSIVPTPEVATTEEVPVMAATIETPTIVATTEAPMLSSLVEDAPVKKAETAEFVHLEDYIRSNIEQTDALIGKINASHEAKLEEAAGYKSEKERFADLEASAYKDAERMVAERLHAEKMKAYFEKQLEEEDSSEEQTEASIPPVEVKTEVKEEAPKAQDELFYDEPPMEEDITLVDDTGINGSVETALTGLAVQNTVNKAIDKKHKIKKQEEAKEETFSLV